MGVVDFYMNTKTLADIFKALSHPNRLELYLEIVRFHRTASDETLDCYVSDIINSLNTRSLNTGSSLTIGSPTISHHLKALSNAGLIYTQRKGKFLTAGVNIEIMDEIILMLKFNL